MFIAAETAADWSKAFEVFGIGFSVVFGVLVILAVTISLFGLVVRAASKKKEKDA